MGSTRAGKSVSIGLVAVLVSGMLADSGDRAGAAPASPTPDCRPTNTRTFENPSDVVIPEAVSVVSSPIVVEDVPGVVLDVEVTTDLEHSYARDIDMTVTSPEGTVVTLTTDNGFDNENVFDGTVWSNHADPDGQVPYVDGANGGMVTDTPYTNGSAEPRLTPEESLGAFAGEDPNGQWTLTISDDSSGDGGTLSGWSLRIRTRPDITVLTERIVKNRTPVMIPGSTAVFESKVKVTSTSETLDHLMVTTNLTHTFPADIDMTLTSPRGTVVTLTTDNGGTNDNIFAGTLWSDAADPDGAVPYVSNNGLVTDSAYLPSVVASPLVPEEPLAAFAGEDPNGTWTLRISDDQNGDGGALTSWTLDLFSLSDTHVCGAKVTAKAKQKFKKKVAIKVKAKAAEKATAVATGAVTIKGVKGKFALKKAKVKLVAGKAKTLTLRFAGSKKKAKKANAAVKKALAKKKKVSAKITVKVTDQHGNTKTVKKTVRVVR